MTQVTSGLWPGPLTFSFLPQTFDECEWVHQNCRHLIRFVRLQRPEVAACSNCSITRSLIGRSEKMGKRQKNHVIHPNFVTHLIHVHPLTHCQLWSQNLQLLCLFCVTMTPLSLSSCYLHLHWLYSHSGCAYGLRGVHVSYTFGTPDIILPLFQTIKNQCKSCTCD